jgi:hypothetical protein
MSNSKTETEGYWRLTDFGNSNFFKAYSVLILLLETIVPLVILLVFNIITLIKFKSIMSKKKRLTNTKTKAKKATIKFTKLILALTFICILARTFDNITAIFKRLKTFYYFQISDEFTALIDLNKQIAYALLFAVHALDGILYFIYDKEIKRVFHQMFCAEKKLKE